MVWSRTANKEKVWQNIKHNLLYVNLISGPMEVLVRKPPMFTVEPEPLYQRKVNILKILETKKIFFKYKSKYLIALSLNLNPTQKEK